MSRITKLQILKTEVVVDDLQALGFTHRGIASGARDVSLSLDKTHIIVKMDFVQLLISGVKRGIRESEGITFRFSQTHTYTIQ